VVYIKYKNDILTKLQDKLIFRKWYFNQKIWQGFDKSDMALHFFKFYYKKV